MGLSCRLRGTSAAVGRGRRTRRNGRETRKFAREVPATFGDSSFAPAAWSFAVSTDPMEHRGGCRFVKKRRDAPRIELACGDFRLRPRGICFPQSLLALQSHLQRNAPALGRAPRRAPVAKRHGRLSAACCWMCESRSDAKTRRFGRPSRNTPERSGRRGDTN